MTKATPALAVARPADAGPVALIRRHAAGIAVALVLAGMLIGPRWWLLATDPSEGRCPAPHRSRLPGGRASDPGTGGAR